MPHIQVKTSSGTIKFHYTISTPKSPNAQSIDSSLPTVIFLHPIYIAQVIYQPQFSDPHLRRFNLVAIDARCHGETSGEVEKDYNCSQAAEDVCNFMDALHLPPCHFVGLSMGACTALELSVSNPEKVLSLFLISPIPLTEPPEVVEGREEIYQCWKEGFRNPKKVDKDALLDAVSGALQLGFNSMQSSLISSMSAVTVPHAMKNWSPTHFDEFYTVSVKFFAESHRSGHTPFSKIPCPVRIVHCSDDIAYPVEHTELLAKAMEDAGVDVEVIHVGNACHFGTVTHSKEINPVLHDFVLENHRGSTPPAALPKVTSPFEDDLVKAGWDPLEDADEEYV